MPFRAPWGPWDSDALATGSLRPLGSSSLRRKAEEQEPSFPGNPCPFQVRSRLLVLLAPFLRVRCPSSLAGDPRRDLYFWLFWPISEHAPLTGCCSALLTGKAPG